MNYFNPDHTHSYTINTFDDGNERFQQYPNTWFTPLRTENAQSASSSSLITAPEGGVLNERRCKYGEWRGKIALVNALNPKIRIESISEWKTLRLNVSLSTVENHLYQANGSGKYSSNSLE
jgi:hypothetical protein